MVSRAARLAELRALRASGNTRLATYEVPEEQKLYEEVDEESYRKVVRRRLDQDDFVVDDNGEGYADDGREEWDNDRPSPSVSSSEDERSSTTRASKRKREDDPERKENIDQDISRFFNARANASAPKVKPIATVEDVAFMDALLGDVGSTIPAGRDIPQRKTTNLGIRKKARTALSLGNPNSLEHVQRSRHTLKEEVLEDAPIETPIFNDDGFAITESAYHEANDPPLPSPPGDRSAEDNVTTAKIEEDDNIEIAEVSRLASKSSAVNISGTRATAIPKKNPYPSPNSSSPLRSAAENMDASSWTRVTESLEVLSSSAEPLAKDGLSRHNVIQSDGYLRMFWIDYVEVNGSLCLFGKVKAKDSNEFVSAFLKVDNVLRNLYFLPRTHRRKLGRDTLDEVNMGDVYTEVDGLMSSLKVQMHKIKPTTRKYAFELPGIPKEAEYLKLLYPYEKPPLSADLTGETFSHVFGTQTALFEQFVLWKNIMGPCWLNISEEAINFDAVKRASWCNLEMQVSDPSFISVMGENDTLEPPPLTVVSIALRTVYKPAENRQEIVLASARVYEDVSLNDATQANKLPSKTFTVVRPYGDSFPIGFKAATERLKGTIRTEKNEASLLSVFLAILQKADPDVLVGHRLDDVDYSILLNRMRERKTPGWHRIGRLKRTEWPKNAMKTGSNFVEKQLAAGRLLCDLGNDLGKSLMAKCQSWSLDEMCELVLGEGKIRCDIDSEAALKTWAATSDGLLKYIRHVEADTYFIAAIAMKVQMLPLTKILTNLAGNSWARTLSGTRAERNEYILLHEFYKNKYICPDKIWSKWKQKAGDEDATAEDNPDAKKKDKYKGGLVFEPEKGLYDRFILVMDFNSLYPSIIQEFNICFTTVERSGVIEDEESLPELPSDQGQGILPKLIATLVSRRREVKKLMKDKSATAEQLATWDIKQLALKLTANSMYGCLGYSKSRFYARPLAMLITAKGREILRSTKELAESEQLRVIYGDTDSVMINTNVDTVQEAIKVGNNFKRSVNERYKLLEIDIDNIFRRLLLHAKKKYAAINLVEVDGKFLEKLEVKGLDMRRREYCALSKDTSTTLLHLLLSGENLEVVVEKVHEHLRELAEKMRNYDVPVQKYIIYTQLGKDPKEYPNANSMPSVQVALKLRAKGKAVKAKDVMSFIITGDSGGSAENAARNACTIEEVQNKELNLKPDINYYLHKQILPPVERLCAPITGTNISCLAECLGLDATKYRITSSESSRSNDQEIQPLGSQIPDSVRFGDCNPLQLDCPHCHSSFEFRGVSESHALMSNGGIQCPSSSCRQVLTTLCISAQLESQIRQSVARYYSSWLVCDDSDCKSRTRVMSVYGHRCLGPKGLGYGCLGRMKYEYGETALYNQLLYLQRILDVDKRQEKPTSTTTSGAENIEKVKVLAEVNRERFGILKNCVNNHLENSGRMWVAMDNIFKFMIDMAPSVTVQS